MVLTTITAWVEGDAAPAATPMFGFHPGDAAVNGGEEKGGGVEWSWQEVCGAGVSNGAGRSAGGKGLAVWVGFGNGHDERVDGLQHRRRAVLAPVPLSDIHQGLPEVREIPWWSTILGSGQWLTLVC